MATVAPVPRGLERDQAALLEDTVNTVPRRAPRPARARSKAPARARRRSTALPDDGFDAARAWPVVDFAQITAAEPHARTAKPRHAPRTQDRAWAVVLIVLLSVGLFDDVLGLAAVHWLAWVAAVLMSGTAALFATVAAEQGANTYQARRWYVQALGSGAAMLLVMSAGPTGMNGNDTFVWLTALATAALLGTLATTYLDGPRWRSHFLHATLDAVILAATVTLTAVVIGGASTASEIFGAVLLGAFGATTYASVVARRSIAPADPLGRDVLPLGAVLALSLCAASEGLRLLGGGPLPLISVPEVLLIAALSLARSAWISLSARTTPVPLAPLHEHSRLRLAPAVAVAAAIVVLSAMELTGSRTRAGFFSIIGVFVLIVGRLLLSLVENSQLLRRVEQSGVFEARLRDLSESLLKVPDREEALAWVCRTAQEAIGADWVLLWMVDASTDELEAAEVLGPKRSSLINRRLPISDPVAIAARVARTREAETVTHVPDSNTGNGFLNVLTRAQSLLAVPVLRDHVVYGVLVCVDSHNPTAFGAGALNKAELLASHVSVAIENVYQQDLQHRRLEEVTALYEFAQSAHTALTPADIVREMMPLVKERLQFTYAAVWLRDPATGTLRLVAGDSPGGAPLAGLRPSALALRAFSTGQPIHAGLGWADPVEGEGLTPERAGVKSELAVPLMLQRRAIGVVDLESRRPNAYSIHDERLLVSLANHAALAIENLHLVGEARKLEALRELDRMKTELLSTVSHELRTPLAGIKGYAQTLLVHEQRLPRAERREFLEIIDSEADRLTSLIENLLDLSRLEAGVLRIDRTVSQLGLVAQDVARKVQLATERHEIVLDWPEDHPVFADRTRMYQVMQNLLTNAVKYSPDGGSITLSAAFGARELTVSVSDDGLGIPSSELARIFDHFHRVGGEVSQRIGGTGLGLAICKGLVEAHGGRIWAESEGEGLGSTIRFTVPLGFPAGVEAHSTSTPKGRL